MKKQAYVIIALTSVLFVLFFSHSLLEILNFDWSIFLHDVEKTEKFIFLLLVFLLRKRKSSRKNGSGLLGICTIQSVRSCLRPT